MFIEKQLMLSMLKVPNKLWAKYYSCTSIFTSDLCVVFVCKPSCKTDEKANICIQATKKSKIVLPKTI